MAHARWREARDRVLAALEAGSGLVALLGAPGVGKTLLLLDIARALRSSGRRVAFVARGDLPVEAAGDEVVLVDEAGRMDRPALEGLGRDRGRSYVLAGLPEHADRLGVGARAVVELGPLSPDEVGGFLAARLANAGQSPDLLTPDAVAKLGSHSAGVPRLINLLAGAAAFLASMEGADRVEGSHVDEAAALRAGARPGRVETRPAPVPDGGSDQVSSRSPETGEGPAAPAWFRRPVVGLLAGAGALACVVAVLAPPAPRPARHAASPVPAARDAVATASRALPVGSRSNPRLAGPHVARAAPGRPAGSVRPPPSAKLIAAEAAAFRPAPGLAIEAKATALLVPTSGERSSKATPSVPPPLIPMRAPTSEASHALPPPRAGPGPVRPVRGGGGPWLRLAAGVRPDVAVRAAAPPMAPAATPGPSAAAAAGVPALRIAQSPVWPSASGGAAGPSPAAIRQMPISLVGASAAVSAPAAAVAPPRNVAARRVVSAAMPPGLPTGTTPAGLPAARAVPAEGRAVHPKEGTAALPEGATLRVTVSFSRAVRGAEERAAALARLLRDAGLAVGDPEPAARRAPKSGITYYFVEDQEGAALVERGVNGLLGRGRLAPPSRDAPPPRPGTIAIAVAGE